MIHKYCYLSIGNDLNRWAMNYYKLAFTEEVKKMQEKYGSRQQYDLVEQKSDRIGLGIREKQMIEQMNHFYIASMGTNEFPYIQHRGGPVGFLKVVDDQTLAFPDFNGNKQYITLGNLKKNQNVSLFIISYPHQARLKVYAEVEVLEPDKAAEIFGKQRLEGYEHRVERVFILNIKAWDWNCSQHITPRYEEKDIAHLMENAMGQIDTLKTENERLKRLLENTIK